MVELFHTLIYQPLYNALIALLHVVPGANVAVAVILLTIFVKTLLLPFALQASRTQRKMRTIAPEVEKIKKQYAEDRQEQALQLLALYKKHNIRPFASIVVMFAQIPVILGLYFVFWKGGLPEIDPSLLYSFVTPPDVPPSMDLFGIHLTERSLLLAVLAGVTQFFVSKVTLPPLKPRSETPDLKEDLARSMQLQMLYGIPFLITIVAYSISSVVALYWVTSNLFSLLQELTIRWFQHKQKGV